MSLLVMMVLAQPLNLNQPGAFGYSSDSPALGIFGALKVSEETSLETLTFQYAINSEYVSTISSDGGTITQAHSSAVISTGALDGGYAEVRSRRLTRYAPGQGVRLRFTTVFSTCRAGNTQEVGLGNETDFLGFGCVGATFGMIHRVGGVQTFVAKSAWNGTPISFDHTKGNIFSVAYQWLGYGVMRGMMEKPDGTFITVHTFKFPNTRTTPTFANPALRLRARTYNYGNATNVTLSIPSAGIVLEGRPTSHGVRRGFLNRKTVTTTPVSVLNLRNNATWGDAGVENMTRIQLNDIYVSGTGASDINCSWVENAGITAPTWVNTNLDTAISATDILGGTLDGGTARHAWVLEGNSGGISLNLEDLHLEPGDTGSVYCFTVTGSSTVGAAVNWSEEF